GAGLDVLSVEPPSDKNPLLKAANCFLTPHIGWATHESRSRLMDIAAENLKAFLAGSAVNVITD
ncbi:MAG: D-2-hydroxyacid dehydrogenase, partial [Bacteroidetes bacterium]|nr:D-2-hydroxyacid dehydrogenase [Bacteroidota bacterium]